MYSKRNYFFREEGGAGNLVVCEIVKMHISENVLNEHHQIDPNKIDLVGRMGGNGIVELPIPHCSKYKNQILK